MSRSKALAVYLTRRGKTTQSIVLTTLMNYTRTFCDLGVGRLPKEVRNWRAHKRWSSPELALDLGCGTGQGTHKLAVYFEKVIGTDPSGKQLESAVQKGNSYCIDLKNVAQSTWIRQHHLSQGNQWGNWYAWCELGSTELSSSRYSWIKLNTFVS